MHIKQGLSFLVCISQRKKGIRTKGHYNTDTQIFTFSYLRNQVNMLLMFFKTKTEMVFGMIKTILKTARSEPIWRLSEPIEVRTKWKTKGIRFKIR